MKSLKTNHLLCCWHITADRAKNRQGDAPRQTKTSEISPSNAFSVGCSTLNGLLIIKWCGSLGAPPLFGVTVKRKHCCIRVIRRSLTAISYIATYRAGGCCSSCRSSHSTRVVGHDYADRLVRVVYMVWRSTLVRKFALGCLRMQIISVAYVLICRCLK